MLARPPERLRSIRFRPLLVSACAMLAVAPGLASAREARPQDDAGQVAERLSDPATQLAVSAALVAMSEALLQMRIEPFARAAEAAGAGDSLPDLPPDARLRDLAGPRADRVQQGIARNVPRAMGATAGMAGALEDMLPELRAAARRMKDSLPRQ